MIQVSSGIEIINHGSNIDYLYGPYIFVSDPDDLNACAPPSDFPDTILDCYKFKRVELNKTSKTLEVTGNPYTLKEHLLEGTTPQKQYGRTVGILLSISGEQDKICEYWNNGGVFVKKQPKIDLPDSVEFYNHGDEDEWSEIATSNELEGDYDDPGPMQKLAITPLFLREWNGAYYDLDTGLADLSNLLYCAYGAFGSAATGFVSRATAKEDLTRTSYLIPEKNLKTLLNHGMGFKSCEVSTTADTPWTVHLAHLTRNQVEGANGNDQITLLLQASHYTVNNQIGLISISARRMDATITWFPKWDLENTRNETEFFNASELYLGPPDETATSWDLYLTTTYQKSGNHYLSVQILSDPNDDVTLKMVKVDSRPEAAVQLTKVAIPTSVPKYSGGSHIKISSENAISLANSVVRSNDKPIPLADSGNVALLELIKITKQPLGYRGTLLITGKGLWNGVENAGSTIITWSINSNDSDGDSVGISALNLTGYNANLSSIQYILKINDANSFSIFAKLPSRYSSYNVIAFDSFAEFATGDYVTVASSDIKEGNVLFQFAKNVEEYKKIPNTAVESVPLYTHNDMTNSISDLYHMGGIYPATKALTPDALAYWDGSFNATPNTSGVSVHSSRLAHCSLGLFTKTAVTDLLLGDTINSSTRDDYRGYFLTGTINGTTYNDWGKVPTVELLCYWNGRYKNGDGDPWSNLKYCLLGEFKNGAVTQIPTNYSTDWHLGLFVKTDTSEPILSPNIWSGPAFTGDKFTLLGSRGTGAIGAPESSSSIHRGNLCTWANNIEFYSPSSTSTKLGNLTITSDGITYNEKITAASFYESSDARLKDAQSSNLTLDQITSIPLVNFTWKDKRDLKHHLGTIAQDVQEVAPEIVDKDADGMLSVEYDKLGVLAIDAVRQLKEIVDKQADMIKLLQDQIQTLKEKK